MKQTEGAMKIGLAITNLPTRMMMGIPSEGMLISAVYEYDGHEGLNLLMLDDAIPAGAKLLVLLNYIREENTKYTVVWDLSPLWRTAAKTVTSRRVLKN